MLLFKIQKEQGKETIDTRNTRMAMSSSGLIYHDFEQTFSLHSECL